jgi:integrase/recombinase XerD
MPRGRVNPIRVERTLKQLFEEFISECEFTKGLRAATLVGYTASFEHFSTMMPEVTSPQALTVGMLNEFFKRIRTRVRTVGRDTRVVGLNDSTVKTYASKLNVFFEWMVQRNIKRDNPLRLVKIPRPKYTDSRALESEDIQKVYAAIALHSRSTLMLKRDTLMVSLLYFCGLRLGEFISLKVTDIDMRRQLLTVRAETSKSKNVRHLPINTILLFHLKEYFEERNRCGKRTVNLIVSTESDSGLSRHGLKHWVKKLIMLSGVKFHLHRFRHSFACALAEKNVNIVKIQKFMGHSDPRMTSVYLRSIVCEDLREDINLLSI